MDKVPERCHICFKISRKKSNLYRHLRQVHGVEPNLSGNIRCPECSTGFFEYHAFRQHIGSVHEVNCNYSELQFRNFNDFHQWKKQFEQETKCSYIQSTSPKVLASKYKTCYYVCHRTGIFHSQSRRKKCLKTVGTKQINGNCPSTMTVTIKKNKVDLLFYKTHFGHTIDDPFHASNLNEEDECKTAGELKDGIPMERLLDDFNRVAKGFHQIENFGGRDFCMPSSKKFNEEPCNMLYVMETI